MKKNELMTEEEWIEIHKNDIQNVKNLVRNLDKDRKIQKLYKKYIKSKSRNNKISYNNEEKLPKNFKKSKVLSSYEKEKSFKAPNFKLGNDNNQRIFG